MTYLSVYCVIWFFSLQVHICISPAMHSSNARYRSTHIRRAMCVLYKHRDSLLACLLPPSSIVCHPSSYTTPHIAHSLSSLAYLTTFLNVSRNKTHYSFFFPHPLSPLIFVHIRNFDDSKRKLQFSFQ